MRLFRLSVLLKFKPFKPIIRKMSKHLWYYSLSLIAAFVFIILYCSLYIYDDDMLPVMDYSITQNIHQLSEENKVLHLSNFYKKYRYDTSFEYPNEYRLRDLLSVNFGPDKGRLLESIDDLELYDSDPRLIWSVYLNYILTHELNEANLLPFSWYDWADFHDLNKLLSLKKTEINCEFFFNVAFPLDTLIQIEEELDEPLFTENRDKYGNKNGHNRPNNFRNSKLSEKVKQYCKVHDISDSLDDSRKFPTRISITNLFDRVRPEVYRLQSRYYVLTTLSHPLSITIMNKDKASYQILVQQNSRENIIQSGMFQKFMGKAKYKYDLIFDYKSLYKRFLSAPKLNLFLITIKEFSQNERNIFQKGKVYLNESDFEFDAINKIKELENRSLSLHEKMYLDSLKYSINIHYGLAPKYFDEPNIMNVMNSGRHYDKRFFNGELTTDLFKLQSRLNSLIRNFQKFTKANNLISWLSHGTLYGYIYNGEMFPWDNDFDIQMPIRHLHLLAQYFNQSLILEDPTEGNGRFLLDVGSIITKRINGNGKNNIDARFIDIDSGLYIDITGLSVSSAYLSDKFTEFYNENKLSVDNNTIHKDPNLISNLASLPLKEYKDVMGHTDMHSTNDKISIDSLIIQEANTLLKSNSPDKDLPPEARYNVHYQLKLYNCRNNHFVHFNMVSPLINTYFHGISSFVPNQYVTILKNEYKVPSGFTFTRFFVQAFIPEFRSWITTSFLRNVINKNNQNQEMSSLNPVVNVFQLSEIRELLKNIAIGGYDNELSILYNSLEVTTYRLKELEIVYDYNCTDKRNKLNLLRTSIGSSLKQSFKDPYLYTLETRLWEFYRDTEIESSKKALNITNFEIAEKLWKWTSDLDEGTLEFLISNQGKLDFNKIGKKLITIGKVVKNNIFLDNPTFD